MSVFTHDVARLTGQWRARFAAMPGPRLQASGVPAVADHLLRHLREQIPPPDRRVAAETLLIAASTASTPVPGSPRLTTLRVQHLFAQAYAALQLLDERFADVVAGLEDTT